MPEQGRSSWRGTYIRDGESTDDSPCLQVPEAQRIICNDTQASLEDRKWYNVVRSKNDALVPVYGKTVRIEKVCKDVGLAGGVLGLLGDDVKVIVCLNQTAWRGSTGGCTHLVSTLISHS